jgi:hypothetical protein
MIGEGSLARKVSRAYGALRTSNIQHRTPNIQLSAAAKRLGGLGRIGSTNRGVIW